MQAATLDEGIERNTAVTSWSDFSLGLMVIVGSFAGVMAIARQIWM